MECVCSAKGGFSSVPSYAVSGFLAMGGLCSVPSLGTVKAAKLGDTLLLALALDSKDLQACHLQKHACFIVIG
jgi:hypothetical protein